MNPTIRQFVTECLQSRGVVPTRQRIAIGEVLFERCDHWSADRLLPAVNKRGVKVSKATLYNNLRLFVRRGLVREVFVNGERVFFDSNTAQHHHFYDVSADELIDISADSVTLTVLPALPCGCELEGVDVVVRIRRKPSA